MSLVKMESIDELLKKRISTRRLIIGALFDSGNGCYKQAVDKYFGDKFEIYSIGLDRENKNTHFINMDLSKHDDTVNALEELNLPAPDIILASPPCESGSLANSPRQAYHNGKSGPLFEQKTYTYGETTYAHYKRHQDYESVQNTGDIGKGCILTTLKIIEYFKPKIGVIENPLGYIGDYIYRDDFTERNSGVRNRADYGAYGYCCKKPEIFGSNVSFNLKLETKEQKDERYAKTGGKKMSALLNSYNARSNIPLELIKDLLEQVLTRFENNDFRHSNLFNV